MIGAMKPKPKSAAKPFYHNYSTHQEALMTAFANTSGTVVEDGCGYYSTPLLAALCRGAGREFSSFDGVADWQFKFNQYGVECRHISEIEPFHCGLLLVDGPVKPTNRQWVIDKWQGFADVILAHDSEPKNAYKYNYDFSRFKHVATFAWQMPHTTVLSDKIDVTKWRDFLVNKD